jgi:FkbM family methyltransferase
VPFLREVLSPDVTYVDGGAFDGDTAEDFLELASGRFGRIHLVEPDARNLERAKLRFQGRIDLDQIAYHPTAIGTRHGLVGFNALGSVGSAVDEAVDEKVRTVPLSAFGSDSQMYIKLDIEGLEIDAIAAELDFLSSCRPLLGISVYHRPDDLLDAVKLIQTASPEYRLYLRCHGEAGEDLLLYAIS